MADETAKTRDTEPTVSLTPEETRQRKRRNVAIALMVVGFVLIIYLVTILRLGGSVVERSF